MALKSTIYKVELQIADIDRSYYQTHGLTIARHPSETDERMMIRVLAFALYASDSLNFGKGLSDTDEPDLWDKDLTDAVLRWIEVGQPDETRIRKACNRAEHVVVLPYGGHATQVWWAGLTNKVARHRNLEVIAVDAESSTALAALAQRSMRLQVTIQDGEIWIGDDTQRVAVTLQPLQAALHT
jgi:uncharacterized protein YaeQ